MVYVYRNKVDFCFFINFRFKVFNLFSNLFNRPSRQYLKKSLTPGTVSIVLAGPHKGKRVVFLKQLESGLRINQIYLIGTSTKVDLGHDFEVPEHINDKYFRRVKLNKRKHKKDEADIFNVKPKKYIVSAVKKVDQKVVDVNVLKAMKKRKDRRSLCAYMSTKFSLKNHQFPHALKF
ncbi:60S ribosomal protein L6 [Armadillidium vulgare]|nr:60S ribosomal protein L6 [Armadillidium vulgare]